jgi:hypothetical protein
VLRNISVDFHHFHGHSRQPPTADVATRILQGFGRCILSRHRLLTKANTTFRRVLDTSEEQDNAQFYYANIITGESTWTKPSYYYTSEPAIYDAFESMSNNHQVDGATALSSEQGQVQPATKHRKQSATNRSPRVNRV